jgi:hypothetical protein
MILFRWTSKLITTKVFTLRVYGRHEKSLDFDSEHASSSMDVDAASDPSVYGTKDTSASPVTTPKSSDNKTAGASTSSSMDMDAVSHPLVDGTKDVPTPNMSVNETSESAPDGQKHILIEDDRQRG